MTDSGGDGASEDGAESKRGRPRRWWPVLVLGAAAALVAGAVVQLTRPLPRPEVRLDASRTIVVPGSLSTLAWPRAGSAALSVAGAGSLGTFGPDTPVPIASVAKVMTAVVVLHDHPIAAGTDGPTITMRPVDVDRFEAGVDGGLSELPVRAGEQLTERQVLQALLIGSANNMATALAEWDAGSTAAFVAKMNAFSAQLDLTHTHYTDPSGFDARTVSTAADQVRLGEEAMRDATFASIVALPFVDLPVAGRVQNFNKLAGRNGVVGIKTGSTNAAGGCLVFAVRKDLEGGPAVVVGAVLGQPGTDIIAASLAAGGALAASATPLVGTQVVLPAGAKVGSVRTAWGAQVPLVTATPVRVVSWPGLRIEVTARVRQVTTVHPNEAIGSVTASAERQGVNAAVQATAGLSKPSVWWRLTRH